MAAAATIAAASAEGTSPPKPEADVVPFKCCTAADIVPMRCCPPGADQSPPVIPPRVLIGIVAWSRAPDTKSTLWAGVNSLAGEAVSWVVALYRGKKSDFDDITAFAKSLGVNFIAYDARKRRQICPFCPKLQFQLTFLKYSKDVDYVWLADEDILFARFNWQSFWTKHAAAASPLIAQPLITPATQAGFFMVNAEQWKHCNTSSHVLSNLIEQQTPVMNARFFEWFGSSVKSFAKLQQEMGTDWGLDRAWCGAASQYREAMASPTEPPCAIIFEAIEHLDTHTITTREIHTRNRESGQKINAYIWQSNPPKKLKVMRDFAHASQRILLDHLDPRRNLKLVEGCMSTA